MRTDSNSWTVDASAGGPAGPLAKSAFTCANLSPAPPASLPPPSSSPDLTAMSQSTTLHSLQSYPSSTHYQDPELYAAASRYQSNPRAALLYSPLQSAAGLSACGRNGGGGTLYTLQSARAGNGGMGGGGGGPTYYATSTTNSRGTAISHIYQVVE